MIYMYIEENLIQSSVWKEIPRNKEVSFWSVSVNYPQKKREKIWNLFSWKWSFWWNFK